MSNIYDIRNHCTNILPGRGTVTTIKEIFHSLADGQEGSETPLAYGEGDYLAALEAEEIAAGLSKFDRITIQTNLPHVYFLPNINKCHFNSDLK